MPASGRAAMAPRPVKDDTHDALVRQVIDVMARVLRHYLPEDTVAPGGPDLDPDTAPALVVSIATSGSPIDVVTWSFSPSLARAVTEAMARGAGLVECAPADAACELANVMLGNAAQLLESAGLAVELTPPQVMASDARPSDAAEFTVATPHGRMRVFIQPGTCVT